jgi:hypothetical protein
VYSISRNWLCRLATGWSGFAEIAADSTVFESTIATESVFIGGAAMPTKSIADDH